MSSKVAAYVLAGSAFFALSNVSWAENVGISQSDAVTYSGAFSISNDTGMTINYFVKWGNKSAWKPVTLANHRVETHSHSLDGNKLAPTPYVNFDSIGRPVLGAKDYKMTFTDIQGGGYGPGTATPRGTPHHYRFVVNGRKLDLVDDN